MKFGNHKMMIWSFIKDWNIKNGFLKERLKIRNKMIIEMIGSNICKFMIYSLGCGLKIRMHFGG